MSPPCSLRVLAHLFGELVAPSTCAACDLPVAPGALLRIVRRRVGLYARSERRLRLRQGVADAVVRYKYPATARARGRLRARDDPGRACVRRSTSSCPFHSTPPLPSPSVARAIRPRSSVDRSRGPSAGRTRPARSRAFAISPMQSALDGAERRENLAGAFRVRHSRAVTGKNVLLVDDVRTTGSTLAACTTALHEVGANRVFPSFSHAAMPDSRYDRAGR